MRFIVDECTGPKVAQWLRDQNYEVFSVFNEMRGIDDETILQKAYSENWILITNDKDFGEKVYREHFPHHGIVFMRLADERTKMKIEVLRLLLENYADKLPDQFVVVTATQVRIAKT